MKIKRLELNGFKSFMSKTVINFDSSITGVVGPNGCGKSNIVDALIWVMGEQSPKSLRGSNMEDVIFKGSDNRSPSSLCEVSVTLENDGVFPTMYSNFSEIIISRRLYRNGESEYLINKIQTRLKDIKEIFMDSGARTYAVIEQGEIERIILSKAIERRSLIEEAAGITKYKVRKEESSRKLDSTEQNLLRLTDILSELTDQLTNVEKQARRAEKYKKIKVEISNLETKIATVEFKKITETIMDAKNFIEIENNKKINLENILSNTDLELERSKSQKLGVEEKNNDLQNFTIELNTDIHKTKAKLEVIHSEITNIDKRVESNILELNSLEFRLRREKLELNNLSQEYNSHEKNTNDAEIELLEAQQNLNKLLEENENQENELDNIKAKQIELAQDLIINENIINGNVDKVFNNRIRIDRLQEERLKKETELNTAKDLCEILLKNITNIKNQKIDSIKLIEEKNSLLSSLKTQVRDKEADKSNIKTNFDRLNSRLLVLQELENKNEGFSIGTKVILENKNENIKGILANIVKVQKKYEKVLEAVLGTGVETIIVDKNLDVLEFLNILKSKNSGRASFISLENNFGVLYRNNEILNEAGVISLFVDLLNFEDKYSSALNLLFKNIYLVDSIDTAIRLKSLYNDNIFVSTDGDYVDQRGVFTGGSAQSISSSVFQRKREIQELIDERLILIETLKIYDEEINRFNSDIENLCFTIDNFRNNLSCYAIDEASLLKEFENSNDELSKINQRIAELSFDIDQLLFENIHLEKELSTAKDNKITVADKKVLFDGKFSEIRFLREQNQKNLIPARENLTKISIHFSTINERFKSVTERKAFLEEAISTDTIRYNNLKIEDENSSSRLNELNLEIKNLKENNLLKVKQLDEVNNEIIDIKQLYDLYTSIIKETELKVKETANQINLINSVISEYNIILAGETSKLNSLSQRLFEKYGVHIESITIENILDEEVLLNLQHELDELNQTLLEFGQVNLLAIEEYERIKQRFDFLNSQKTDIEKSIGDLKYAIKKIDETSRERFKNAFELVNDKFQKFFPILFGGGKAKLVLTEPEDFLTTGVDILAQLPGKKTQNINLFSGGEKALTAISLVFSIFAIKPSPFCVLDEVDAPLDDANITRFNEAVKALIDKTQFVIITHNKRTMEMVDVLYGITMEEPGVSRMISVRISEKNKVKDLENYIPDSTSAFRQQLTLQ